MQQKSHTLALTMALGLATAMPAFAQSLTTEPTRPPERIAPSAAPIMPSANMPVPGTITPGLTGGQTTATQPGTAMPTARPSGSATTGPVPGANSFTESQTRGRIEAAGYTQVANLRKQDDGIWRGDAMRGSTRVTVLMDFHGDVSVQR